MLVHYNHAICVQTILQAMKHYVTPSSFYIECICDSNNFCFKTVWIVIKFSFCYLDLHVA